VDDAEIQMVICPTAGDNCCNVEIPCLSQYMSAINYPQIFFLNSSTSTTTGTTACSSSSIFETVQLKTPLLVTSTSSEVYRL
jgi:hypothetical protein